MCGFCVCAGIRVYYHCAVRLRYAAWCLHAEKVFHLGADETGRGVSGDLCSKQGQQADSNAAQIERKLLKLVVENGKQPAGWEEMPTETRAALNTSAIISAWSKIAVPAHLHGSGFVLER